MAFTGSPDDALTPWVAPSSRALTSLESTVSTAMIMRARGDARPLDGGQAHTARPEHGDGATGLDPGRVQDGAHARGDAAADEGGAIQRMVSSIFTRAFSWTSIFSA